MHCLRAHHCQSVNSGGHAGACSGFPEQQSGATLRRRSLWAAKGRGYGRHASAVMLCPPIARHALPLSGSPGSMIPPVRHRLKRMAGFRHCGTQKQYLPLPLQPPGKIRPRAATPGHTRSYPGARTAGKSKMHHERGMLQNDSESHDFAKGVAQACH